MVTMYDRGLEPIGDHLPGRDRQARWRSVRDSIGSCRVG